MFSFSWWTHSSLIFFNSFSYPYCSIILTWPLVLGFSSLPFSSSLFSSSSSLNSFSSSSHRRWQGNWLTVCTVSLPPLSVLLVCLLRNGSLWSSTQCVHPALHRQWRFHQHRTPVHAAPSSRCFVTTTLPCLKIGRIKSNTKLLLQEELPWIFWSDLAVVPKLSISSALITSILSPPGSECAPEGWQHQFSSLFCCPT